MTDPAEFTSLYRQHSSGIYRFALHMSGSTSVAEEVAQDCFIKAYRSLASFQGQHLTDVPSLSAAAIIVS